METKEPIKITLSTALLIMTIIVILIMGYLLVQSAKTEQVSNEKIEDLQKQVNSLQEEKNEMEDYTENVTLNLTENSTTNTVDEEKNNTFTSAEAQEIATEVYEKAYDLVHNETVNVYGTYTVKGKQEEGYKVDISKLEKVFSKKAMEKIKGQLVEQDGQYYDVSRRRLLYNNGCNYNF